MTFDPLSFALVMGVGLMVETGLALGLVGLVNLMARAGLSK